MDERAVERRVRLALAVATAGWLLPWGAWAAGDGGILGVAAAIVAAFGTTPLAGVAVTLVACLLQWGGAGSATFLKELADLLAGRAVDPHLYTDLWQVGLWLFVGWRAAAAAARPATRDGVETEGKRGLAGWMALAALSAVAPGAILGPAFFGLLAFAGGALDGLAHSQLNEFEHRFGALSGRGSFQAATRLSLGLTAAAAVLGGWIIGGGGGILARALDLAGRALSYALAPILLGLGYLAEALVAIFKWLLHGKKLKMPKLATMSAAPLKQVHQPGPAHAPAWAVLSGRWLLALAVIAAVVVVLGLLRARRRDRAEAVAVAEEREPLPPEADGPQPPRRRSRRSFDPDGALRRLFRRWLALAGEHGSPRRAEETAAEHFRRVLPAEVRGKATDLLEAYQRARYGQHAAPGAQQAAEAALERIRRQWR